MKRRIINLAIILFFVLFLGSAVKTRDKYFEIYNRGVSLLESGQYFEAIECFENISNYMGYRDIPELLEKYQVVCPECGSVLK